MSFNAEVAHVEQVLCVLIPPPHETTHTALAHDWVWMLVEDGSKCGLL